MVKRAIVVFPDLTNIEIIKGIRNRYDPLSTFINPHITLVFPFDSELSNDEVESHIKKAVTDIAPFELVLKGITVNVEPLENYIFLNIPKGIQEVYELSKVLYTGILKKYQSERYEERYIPHMTIGRLDKVEDHEKVLVDIGYGETAFTAFVDRVSVEIIGTGKSSTEAAIKL